jgi:hypothetical protein
MLVYSRKLDLMVWASGCQVSRVVDLKELAERYGRKIWQELVAETYGKSENTR